MSTIELSSAIIQARIDELNKTVHFLNTLLAQALAAETYDLHVGDVLIVTFSHDPVSIRVRIEAFRADDGLSLVGTSLDDRHPGSVALFLRSKYATWVKAPKESSL